MLIRCMAVKAPKTTPNRKQNFSYNQSIWGVGGLQFMNGSRNVIGMRNCVQCRHSYWDDPGYGFYADDQNAYDVLEVKPEADSKYSF